MVLNLSWPAVSQICKWGMSGRFREQLHATMRASVGRRTVRPGAAHDPSYAALAFQTRIHMLADSLCNSFELAKLEMEHPA